MSCSVRLLGLLCYFCYFNNDIQRVGNKESRLRKKAACLDKILIDIHFVIIMVQ
jgi:hypothetical protein